MKRQVYPFLLAALAMASASSAQGRLPNQGDKTSPANRQGDQSRPRQGGANQVWALLAQKYDKNKDGQISASEYPRGEAKFKAFDRNGDGVLTKDDVASGGRRMGRRRQGSQGGRNPRRPGQRRPAGAGKALFAKMALRMADSDGNRQIQKKEWQEFCNRVLKAKPSGFGIMARVAKAGLSFLDTNKNKQLDAAELDAWFASQDKDKSGSLAAKEIVQARPKTASAGSSARGGQNRRTRGNGGRGSSIVVGQVAPDFDLPKIHDAKETVKLSSFANKKPVALIFGSYT